MDQATHQKPTQLIDAEGVLRAHAYVVEQLKRLTVEALKQLQQEVGISWRTLQKIRSGEIVDPGVGNIEKLANHFSRPNDRPAERS